VHGLNPARGRRPAAVAGRHGLMARLVWPSRQLDPAGSDAARRAHCPWSPRGGLTHDGGLVRPAASSRATRCGGTGGVAHTGKGGGAGQGELRRGSPQQRRVGGAVGRRCAVVFGNGGAGTVVTDDAALVLHHGERGRKVRWGLRKVRRGAASGSPSGWTVGRLGRNQGGKRGPWRSRPV
jgi:hypothetical protein